MGHKKLIKFEAIKQYANVLQHPENMKGNWGSFYKNDNPIVLELACGKGEYSVGLGRQNRDVNYLGIDIKGNRIYNGATIALREQLTNVAFLRIPIDNITKYFTANEVADIWIIFPDPFLKKETNRLTHPRFLTLYKQILKPSGRIRLKTDSPELYEFTLETIAAQGCILHENLADIYANGLATGPLTIQTYYESLHLADGRKIYYVSFSLPEHDLIIPERYVKHAQTHAAGN
jgi:tRNA (guanine-N7-)-methyltransferase